MVGRVGGPGGRRRPKGSAGRSPTGSAPLSPADEESGPEAGGEGRSLAGLKGLKEAARAEDDALRGRAPKKRADDDFKAALNAKIMLGGMGAPGGAGMSRPRPGLDGGKAAYAAVAAA